MDKRSLRKTIRGLKAEFSSDELRQCSRPIVDKLLSHPKVTLSHTILAYLSMEDEVDTHQLVDRLLAEGHRILLPVVVDDTNFEIREYTGRECLLRQGKYQIEEPQGNPYTALEDIDLVIVPGVAFDRKGHRIGRGRGYYDRFLRKIPQAYKIGVAFDFQLVDSVPVDENDLSMNEILIG